MYCLKVNTWALMVFDVVTFDYSRKINAMHLLIGSISTTIYFFNLLLSSRKWLLLVALRHPRRRRGDRARSLDLANKISSKFESVAGTAAARILIRSQCSRGRAEVWGWWTERFFFIWLTALSLVLSIWAKYYTGAFKTVRYHLFRHPVASWLTVQNELLFGASTARYLLISLQSQPRAGQLQLVWSASWTSPKLLIFAFW